MLCTVVIGEGIVGDFVGDPSCSIVAGGEVCETFCR